VSIFRETAGRAGRYSGASSLGVSNALLEQLLDETTPESVSVSTAGRKEGSNIRRGNVVRRARYDLL
jgi:hypothetical protein